MTRYSDARSGYWVALASGILGVLGLSVDLAFWHTALHQRPPWHFVAMAASLGLVVLLLAYRPARDPRVTATLFVTNNLIIALALWIADSSLAHLSTDWVPFQSEKLGMLTVAFLAPPSPWAGGLSIGIFLGSALLHFAEFDPVLRGHWTAEPWATFIYGVFAILLYAYRLHVRTTEDRIAESLAAKRTVEDVSRMLLALRDFSNTPLQTMFLTTALLRTRHAYDEELLERMDRSLARLRELNEIMSRYEAQVPWQSGDESLDAAAVLQRWLHDSSSTVATPRVRGAEKPEPRTREH